MNVVRLSIDASWYINSESMQIHARVVRFDTLASIEEQIGEIYDRRIEVLAHPNDPPALVRQALGEAMRKWVNSINQAYPF